MKKSIKITLGIIVGVFIVMQFFRIDQTNPSYDVSTSFQQIEQPPQHIATLLENACYDCHSYEVKYPWYSNVAPVSWMLEEHIVEGREHLNFSVWGNYPAKEKADLREEVAEEIQKNKMPLNNYLWLHPEARMTSEEKTQLVSWFNGDRNNVELSKINMDEEHEEGKEEEEYESH